MLALVGVLFLGYAAMGSVQEPAKPAPDNKNAAADLAVEQQILARKYQEFEKALMQLAHRLERSTKPEDRERAANIKKAIAYSADQDVKGKFEQLIKTLQTSKDLSIPEIQGAMKNSGMVADDVHAIIQLLMADARDDELKKEKKRIEDLLKALDEVIRKQKVVRAQTEAGKAEKGHLVGDQKKVTEKTGDIGKAMDKAKEGEAKDPSDGKGKGSEAKDPSDGKGKGQGQGDKPGDKPPMPNPGGNQPKQEGMPGRKQIQDANDYQKKAEDGLEKNDRDNASKNQDKALKELEEARKKLEEILRQLREEELERLLAALEARCQKMLQMQIEVRDGTVRVFKSIDETDDKKPTRSHEQKALQLSDREQQIVDEASKAIQILEAEGPAVAFHEQFLQVREDMRHVARRLGKADVGTVTQYIEEEIIAVLREMIDALKKAQKQLQENRNNPNQNQQNPNQNQKLLDQIAELKMIRSMQLRVNSRTKVYGDKYQGEQTAEPDIQKELMDLAMRQQKIYDVTENIYKGKNK
jgi:hypothetical protein